MSIRNNYRGHNYIRIGEKITQRVIRSAAFDTISVSGQDDIAATSSQSLTMEVVNSGLTLTTNASTDTLAFTVDAGTDTTQGALELATDAEAVAGTDTARAVTPANLTARLTAPQTLSAKTLTSPVLNGTLSGDAFLDEDAMTSNSATKVASQQSIKAYVDNNGGATSGFAIAMAVAL